jgi:ribosomal protein S18 acetylase RimI-like enzyme
MYNFQTSVEIIDVPRERLDEAVDVFARAFENYPLMRHFFAGSGEDYGRQVREAFRITCEIRMTLNDSVKGILDEDGRLVAVACANHPEKKEWPASLEQSFATFEERMPSQAIERLNQYVELGTKHDLEQPHFYLVAIGVRPDAQGQGYGRALLDEVHRMSEDHPFSTGVALDTETISNVPLYEHCGYGVTARDRLGDVDIWYMFRPNEARDNTG